MTDRTVHIRRAIFAVLALLIGVFIALRAGGIDDSPAEWTSTVVGTIGGALCLWRAAVVRHERGAWMLVGLYLVTWAFADAIWTEQPSPNLSDAFYLTAYAFGIIGLAMLLRARARTSATRTWEWLDALIGGLTVCAVAAAIFFGAMLEDSGADTLEALTTSAYPVLDLSILCLIVVAIGSAGWAVDRVWAALAVGLGVNALADGLYGAATLQGHDWLFAWAEPLWPISMLITAAAAWQPRRYVIGGFEGMPALIVPGVASLVSLSLLVYGALPGTDVPLSVTIAATAALIVAGIRSMLTFRENLSLLTTSRTEALTDTLTGLGNRRALMLELDARLRRGRESEPSTLVFFDLDGFKGYNDAFGHSAGDALLVRLSQRLLNAMDQGATAFRPGGDEFCLVLNGILGRGDGAIERCASALSEVGDGFEVGVSFGIVVLPEEADDPVRAMNLVDERMYDDKGDRRMTARRQARDLLLQLLHEREPELEHHVGAVAAIAVSTGRHLGLGDEELDEIARGAELHDLGKVAIPDSILHKPGPLDENEWTLMYQHTVVGERILAAVPTLQPVARLVRASHERWDGGGYPDGIVGEAIPLGARIIALCDAFDAMVSARPYSDAMPVADAIKELRACAGAQFDPAVVAAFVEAFEAGALSHPAFETA